jgi:hypothetical protein
MKYEGFRPIVTSVDEQDHHLAVTFFGSLIGTQTIKPAVSRGTKIKGLPGSQSRLQELSVRPLECVARLFNNKKGRKTHKRLQVNGDIVQSLASSHQRYFTYFYIGQIAYIVCRFRWDELNCIPESIFPLSLLKFVHNGELGSEAHRHQIHMRTVCFALSCFNLREPITTVVLR